MQEEVEAAFQQIAAMAPASCSSGGGLLPDNLTAPAAGNGRRCRF
jgi:hypothetical protein